MLFRSPMFCNRCLCYFPIVASKILNNCSFKCLGPNLVRLFALNEAYQVRKEREFIPTVVIADPYYLSESKLYTMEGQLAAKEYIQNLMLANKDKDTFLLPYFPGPP